MSKPLVKCLELMGKNINVEKSELLLEEKFSSGSFNQDEWIAINDASWEAKDNTLEGKWIKGKTLNHGQLFSRKTFKGDILMEFDAQTIIPSNHDIIWW